MSFLDKSLLDFLLKSISFGLKFLWGDAVNTCGFESIKSYLYFLFTKLFPNFTHSFHVAV
ncbi:hypothetical protein Sbal223_4415 (plasmid) [Shewanella baltica OS223]|nr:hypothetical protein Sbal223_4415 [Shewanella baltica OS223]